MARTRSKKGKGPRNSTKALEGEETPAKDDHSRKEKDDEVESETTAADVINLKFERFFDLPDGNQNKILKMLSELDTVTLSTAMSNKAKRAMLNQRFDDVYRINYEFESIAMLQWIYKCCKIDLVDFRVDIQMKLNEIGRNHITSNLMLFEFLAKKSVSATTAYPDSIQCTLELARLVSTRGHDFDVDRFQDRSVIQVSGVNERTDRRELDKEKPGSFTLNPRICLIVCLLYHQF